MLYMVLELLLKLLVGVLVSVGKVEEVHRRRNIFCFSVGGSAASVVR